MQLVIIFFLINSINALKFILLDGEEKCFLEDLPLETKFSGKFKVISYLPIFDFNIHLLDRVA